MATGSNIELTISEENGRVVIGPVGDWTVRNIGAINAQLRALEPMSEPVMIDLGTLGEIDTAGAYILDRTLRNSGSFDQLADVRGEHAVAIRLLSQVRETCDVVSPDVQKRSPIGDWLSRVGQGTVEGLAEGVRTLSFVGEVMTVCLKLIVRPKRFRGTATVSVMEHAGLDAIPIIMFLAFFIGMVVAFIGASTLAGFGATIFTVELVGFAVLREFGAVLTAIILAGRTNSAFTAQIGAMRMRQEVDAMTVLGLDPMEVLVAPRVIAMLVMTPILSFLATVAGIFGGLVVSWLALDIGPQLFLNRLVTAVPIENFWVGMSKTPFFALVVALIGCRQGLGVGGSVQSLGSATTNSVVQALFSIIIIDAVFAMFYMQMGI